MLARVSASELAEMWADYLIEPWGDDRADWHAAQLSRAITQDVGSSLDDHRILFDGEAKPQQSEEEMIFQCRIISALHKKKKRA